MCGVGFLARTTGERSNDVLQLALEALSRLGHRGAAGADASGDGAGVLTQIPEALLRAEGARRGLPLGERRPFAAGALFLPRDAGARRAAVRLVEETLAADGLPVLGWRDVPVDDGALGLETRATRPHLAHVYVGRASDARLEEDWERDLFLARRAVEERAVADGLAGLYVASLSCRTIVYKALLTGRQLPAFFLDFHDDAYETAIAVFHQRFSTNTLPTWELAHPFRLLAHNGEINTLWGNRNAMAMRRPLLEAPVWDHRVDRVRDAVRRDGSDSASLDNALELLVRSGRAPLDAAMTLLPQAWEKYPDVESDIRAFYELQQALLEPWDGPAAIAFSDGVVAGAALDRNGLRPCRYKVRRDGLVVAASEAGVVDLDPRDVVESGALGPGEVLLVDTRRRVLRRNREAKREVAKGRPFGRWVATRMRPLVPAETAEHEPLDANALAARQRAFGWTAEDVRFVVEPMAAEGVDAVFSMGDDTPLPGLERTRRAFFSFFRQRFAQVTNPPIDPLREGMVMSLRMLLGRRGSPLVETAEAARMLRVERPVLTAREFAGLMRQPLFPPVRLATIWDGTGGGAGLSASISALAERAAALVRAGASLLVLSDRSAGEGRLPIPSALALGAVRRALLREGLRAQTGLVVETGDAFDVHHLAVLFGYGAEAVHPWLALDTARARGGAEGPARWRDAAEKGLLKVLAKTGISTLASYCGGQTFEILGLGPEVVDLAFAGTPSPVGGIGLGELAADLVGLARESADDAALPDLGKVRFRRDAEEHAWHPTVVASLQRAARADGGDAFAPFEQAVAARPPVALRDLLAFRETRPIPIGEVEPEEEILGRFVASAMSLGALSPEAHATLTRAMNRLGASSNSGEGGEDPDLFRVGADGVRADNRIKQVASARFGVTAEYLTRADELEIKIVQGAKPGEGGQLPAHKVTSLVARLRHAVPGVSLISPPPHHDVYSIEDLAQLVHDLKTLNPRARVGVKLVATTGVGTVACGVAKAHADYVLVAGHAGGTGASPLSSIKHTGLPWELGLAEAHDALAASGLRARVELRTDGGFRSGRDVVVAALLGAEAFGFGTAALVALGCVMARQCHLNTCPTGVATQREDLRAKFKGTPEHAVAYFRHVASETRRLLASLGLRSLGEAVGRRDLLERAERPEGRARFLDLAPLLATTRAEKGLGRSAARNERPGVGTLDEEILRDLRPALDAGEPASGSYPIRNHNLSVGARVSGELVRRAAGGRPGGRVHLRFTGSAGQSFGVFGARGLRLDLEGEANDYVGKGLSGAEISVRPFRQAAFGAGTGDHALLGNAALYGATSGALFAAGAAGIRFAVRNSGALAVVEGAGNHACEYMTGGLVVVLGRAGRNFAAGMTNGLAYVLDEDGTFPARLNADMAIAGPLDGADVECLRALLGEHVRRTASPRGRHVLDDLARWRPRFLRVVPADAGGAARAAAIRDALVPPAPLEAAG